MFHRSIAVVLAVVILALLPVVTLHAGDYDGYVYYVDLEDLIYRKEPNSRTEESGYEVSGIVAFDSADSDASRSALENHTKRILRDWADESAQEKTENSGTYADLEYLRYFDSISIRGMEFEEGWGWEVEISGVLVETILD